MHGLTVAAALAFAMDGATIVHDDGRGGEYYDGGYFEGHHHDHEFEHFHGEHHHYHFRDEYGPRRHSCWSAEGVWTCGY
jgi:hypothetical protein